MCYCAIQIVLLLLILLSDSFTMKIRGTMSHMHSRRHTRNFSAYKNFHVNGTSQLREHKGQPETEGDTRTGKQTDSHTDSQTQRYYNRNMAIVTARHSVGWRVQLFGVCYRKLKYTMTPCTSRSPYKRFTRLRQALILLRIQIPHFRSACKTGQNDNLSTHRSVSEFLSICYC